MTAVVGSWSFCCYLGIDPICSVLSTPTLQNELFPGTADTKPLSDKYRISTTRVLLEWRHAACTTVCFPALPARSHCLTSAVYRPHVFYSSGDTQCVRQFVSRHCRHKAIVRQAPYIDHTCFTRVTTRNICDSLFPGTAGVSRVFPGHMLYNGPTSNEGECVCSAPS